MRCKRAAGRGGIQWMIAWRPPRELERCAKSTASKVAWHGSAGCTGSLNRWDKAPGGAGVDVAMRSTENLLLLRDPGSENPGHSRVCPFQSRRDVPIQAQGEVTRVERTSRNPGLRMISRPNPEGVALIGLGSPRWGFWSVWEDHPGLRQYS